MKRIVLPLLLAARAAEATTPPIVQDNPSTYPLGSRAAAMGGAYTALACDEAAVHYNPAALACADASRLELAANAYVLQSLSIPNAFGAGEDVAALNYHSLPAIVGGARILAEGDPVTRQGRWAWGLSVTVPNSIALRVEPQAPTRPSAVTFSGRDAIIAGDLGMGYQLTPTLALGVSVGGAVRTFEAHVAELLSGDQPDCADGACTPYFASATELDATAVGVRGKLAARWTPTPSLAFGLTLTSPTVHVFGRYASSETITFALRAPDATGAERLFYGNAVTRLRGDSELGLSGSASLGVAWQSEDLTLTFDARLYLPRALTVARDLEALAVEGQAPPDALADVTLSRRLHPNFALGGELRLDDGVALAAGLFTDLSAVSDDDFDAGLADRVDAVGVSAALGLLGEQTRAWFGVAASYGRGEAHVPSGERRLESVIAEGLAEDAVADVTRWTVAAFIGSSYSFTGE